MLREANAQKSRSKCPKSNHLSAKSGHRRRRREQLDAEVEWYYIPADNPDTFQNIFTNVFAVFMATLHLRITDKDCISIFCCRERYYYLITVKAASSKKVLEAVAK